MAKNQLGLLFEKKMINQGDDSYEIYILKEAVMGIDFTNTHENHLFNITTGEYAGKYASVFTDGKNEKDKVVLCKSLDEAMKITDNNVDFELIKKKFAENTCKYFIRNRNGSLEAVLDKKLINSIEQELAVNNNIQFFSRDNLANIYSKIKDNIIGQDEPIMKIFTSLYKNQLITRYDLNSINANKLKENILIYGENGTVKKEILKSIAEAFNIPINIISIQSLLDETYTINDFIKTLYLSADKNLKLAEKGILVIEEFDMLLNGFYDDNKNFKLLLQYYISRLLNGEKYYFDDITFNTSHLTIVGLGDFKGVLAKKRLMENSNSININYDDSDFLQDYSCITRGDLINAGLIPEIIENFSQLVAMNSLTKEQLYKILIESQYSPLLAYKKLFADMNVELDYSAEFIDWLIEETLKLNNGVNGLKILLDEYLNEAMFNLFTDEYAKISLIRPKTENDKAYELIKKDNFNKTTRKILDKIKRKK